jgi:hypothetical protein
VARIYLLINATWMAVRIVSLLLVGWYKENIHYLSKLLNFEISRTPSQEMGKVKCVTIDPLSQKKFMFRVKISIKPVLKAASWIGGHSLA